MYNHRERETSWKSTLRLYSVCFHNNNNNYSAFITTGERESLSMRWGWYLLYSGPQWPDLIEDICGNSPLVSNLSLLFFSPPPPPSFSPSTHADAVTYFGGISVRACNYANERVIRRRLWGINTRANKMFGRIFSAAWIASSSFDPLRRTSPNTISYKSSKYGARLSPNIGAFFPSLARNPFVKDCVRRCAHKNE